MYIGRFQDGFLKVTFSINYKNSKRETSFMMKTKGCMLPISIAQSKNTFPTLFYKNKFYTLTIPYILIFYSYFYLLFNFH